MRCDSVLRCRYVILGSSAISTLSRRLTCKGEMSSRPSMSASNVDNGEPLCLRSAYIGSFDALQQIMAENDTRKLSGNSW